MSAESTIDHEEAEEMHEAMDYAQHEGTYATVLTIVKWAIIQLAFIVVGLYASIIAGQAVVGVVLILIGLVAPIGAYFFRPRVMPT